MYPDETCTRTFYDPTATNSAGTLGDFVDTAFDNALLVTADTATPDIEDLDPGKFIIKPKIDIFSLIRFL